MKSITTQKPKQKGGKLYDVTKLYLLTTQQKVKVDSQTIRYITEYFVGTGDSENYYEFFSNVRLNSLEVNEPPIFDKPFISDVAPLYPLVKVSIIDKETLFNLITNINALDRCALDVSS